MFDWRRPVGRFFIALVWAWMVTGWSAGANPPTTTVADTVYRADGTPASGTLLISWPAFTTGSGQPIGAGTTSVKLGAGGSLSVSLIPNAGASPTGTYYTVVFQLDDSVRTEYWIVGTSSPTTLAAVRTTLGTGNAAQLVSKQYVDGAIQTKANDAAVVHNTGTETFAGTKQFAAAPSVPTPSQATDAVNKAYVDAAVATVGSGSYVQKSGDSMTGPLTLSGDPTAPNQATTRHYVDNGLAAKANLVSGVVPTIQLGVGTAASNTCLKGDSSWGACGTSSDAVSIQGVPVASLTPGDGQVITYESASGMYKPKPGGGSGVSAGMQAIKYATDFNWTQSSSTDLSTPGAKVVSLSSCP
ncbi:MAG TPA: hypothetical protein VFJ47_00005, partial [Terriglobales bacterium]|nr:hypothetical protein [Terriglobales bacterium]